MEIWPRGRESPSGRSTRRRSEASTASRRRAASWREPGILGDGPSDRQLAYLESLGYRANPLANMREA